MTRPYLNEETNEWYIKDGDCEIEFVSYEEAWDYYETHEENRIGWL